MEKVDLDYLRGQWKENLGYYWERAHKEINDYFDMIEITNCRKADDLKSKSREQVLAEFSLDVKKLKDPLFIPEILRLLEYIKKNNYDVFPKNWISNDYNHQDRASYIYHYIIPAFAKVAEIVNDFKVNQYNSLYKKTGIETPKKLFISRQFERFGLLHYEHHIGLINSVAYHEDFYVLLPILLRTLFENMLHDIFKTSLNNKHRNLYFNERNNRVADFSILIELLNKLSQSVFKRIIRSTIHPKIIKILKDIKAIGNLSVHDLDKKITTADVDKFHGDVDLVLGALLNSYYQLNGANIIVEPRNLEKIIVKLGLKEKAKKGDKKRKKWGRSNKIRQQDDILLSEISNIMSDIRLFMKNEPLDYITQITAKMDELLLKVKPLIDKRERLALGKLYVLFNNASKSQLKKTAETLFDAINVKILNS